MPVHRLDPVDVALLRLHGVVGVTGGVGAGVGVDGDELADLVDFAVAPQYLVVGDAVVVRVVPAQVNGVVADTGNGQARGRGRHGALLGLDGRSGEGSRPAQRGRPAGWGVGV